MNLLIKNLNPEKLKQNIINLIEQGALKTWTTFPDNEELYIQHTGQLGQKGVVKLTPYVNNKFLKVQIFELKTNKEDIKSFEGYYLGRFCEIIFVNFPKESFTLG